MIESAHVDWSNVPACVEHFRINVSQEDDWPNLSWCAYSDMFGPEVATVYASTRDDAVSELIDWLQGYCEKRYGAMFDEAGFIR